MRVKSEVAATLRLWPSSPIWSIWVRMPVTSTGPLVSRTLRVATWSSGPSTSRIHRRRVSTSGE